MWLYSRRWIDCLNMALPDWLYMALRFNYVAFGPQGNNFLRFDDGDEYMWNVVSALFMP